MQVSDQDREHLQGRLRLAETRVEELAESLKAVTSSMEQYRAMAQSLEESLDKEKKVQNKRCLSLFDLVNQLITSTYEVDLKVV